MAGRRLKIWLGGTFNPIHLGHLITARAVAESLDAELSFVPCCKPPHKPDAAELASAEDRLEMCRLAAEGVPGFEVTDIEIRRGGISYTIDSVRELKSAGWPEVHWLIGTDQVASLPKWHEGEALLREAKFVVMSRAGHAAAGISPSPCTQGEGKGGGSLGPIIQVPAIEISSTEIRRRVAAGLPINFLTPPPVVEYIHRRRLWQRGSPA